MCVVSMVMDHYQEKWIPTVYPSIQPVVFPPAIPTQAEIDEFRKLLDRARKYDKEHGEPDCELDEKKAALKKIADQMGIDIAFIDPPAQSE